MTIEQRASAEKFPGGHSTVKPSSTLSVLCTKIRGGGGGGGGEGGGGGGGVALLPLNKTQIFQLNNKKVNIMLSISYWNRNI